MSLEKIAFVLATRAAAVGSFSGSAVETNVQSLVRGVVAERGKATGTSARSCRDAALSRPSSSQ